MGRNLLGDLSKYKVEGEDFVATAFEAAWQLVSGIEEYAQNMTSCMGWASKYVEFWRLNKDISPYCAMACVIVDDMNAAIEKDKKVRLSIPTIRKSLQNNYKSIYSALAKRDGESCKKCEAKSGLTVDHVVPVILGGTNDIENLQLLCLPCNLTKSDKLL